ncbi:type 1 fimbrial protein [Rhodanobacter glycinis]|uniref:Type 1 fimbrial protein n=1 Tax=Rhodanobacter glycinis TaxID=582702 RepID=A0A502C186_9GAMM|nr:type 1 fimbrial protein [Rhodanobacter glycinis]TPG45941.1 type 1 fimbrial protein [Rhodanobacter glycinis]
MTRAICLWMALLLLALVPAVVSAKCKYSSGGATTVTFSLPPTISIPANMADGTIIASTGQVSPANPPDITCGNFFGETVTYGVANSRGSYLADNVTYETGIPGVGYRITHPTDYLTPYPQNSQYVTTTTFSVTSGLQLIKTGPIASGSVLASGDLADWQWGTLYPETFRLGNSITFTTPSCTIVTNPINVTLPVVTTSAFTGVGSTSGKTPFQIRLNCPTGTAVAKITMHTAAPDSHPGVVQPSGAGYAAGIGVQVLDGNSNPMVFETQTVVTPPNATTSIPYFAQYFQTAPAVTGGAVKATVTFDIFYQ